HPIDVFTQENRELLKVVDKAESLLGTLYAIDEAGFRAFAHQIQACFNDLMDVDKHYKRKEYLVFPFLEKAGITGPPMVMWGKHDEIREQLKGCIEILRHPELKKQDVDDALELLFIPVLKAVADMTKKERDILFPMAMDVLTQEDWWNVDQQTLDFGFTLYDPQVEWRPEGMAPAGGEGESFTGADGVVRLPSGNFTAKEIMAILNTIPVDMTFVDKHDKVKYFTQGEHRIFARSRTIINRDVRLCHPPGSVHIVEKILEDFKSGKASHAPFWIQMRGKFILIEYYALRDENGEYLGTLEVSQDLTHARSLEGEQRILSYSSGKEQP
ncbi:MAG TPA: PAS domain-containing protein, partial [Prolixibacteraceae bacterium]|nr:PAS domain-containing protein [Prolixibacteraceae bacterium]